MIKMMIIIAMVKIIVVMVGEQELVPATSAGGFLSLPFLRIPQYHLVRVNCAFLNILAEYVCYFYELKFRCASKMLVASVS